MKKIFTLAVAALMSLAASATNYKEPLTVELNGIPMPCDPIDVTVDDNGNGSYTFSLANFNFQGMPIGNVTVKNVGATACGFYTLLRDNEAVNITEGDDANVPAGTWLGPSLGLVNIYLNGQIKSDRLSALLNIQSNTGMTIKVFIGQNAQQLGQVPNSDFEAFHTASVDMYGSNKVESDEPNNWHSFMSASGNPVLVYLAGWMPHTFISNDVRPGSTGKQSVKVIALNTGISDETTGEPVIANGTITTGRMNTGSTTATDVDNNYAWSAVDSSDLDANGDPFYVPMNTCPDTLKVWVKYGQGTPNEAHPYATINAVLTDGERFQDPEGALDENGESAFAKHVVGQACNAKITSTNGEWKQMVIPFDYSRGQKNNIEPRNLQITISTNADAGKGSDSDSIFVDDLELVYNYKVKGITIKGKELEGFNKDTYSYNVNYDGELTNDDINVITDGANSLASWEIVSTETGAQLNITVVSDDMNNSSNYTVNFKGATTGINSIKQNQTLGNAKFYDLSGRQISGALQHGIYIVRTADGKTYKMLKK